MPKTITVGLLTDAGGAHLGAYYQSLASSPEVAAVAVSDPSGQHLEAAKKALGNKYIEGFKDPGALLAQVRPQAVLVSLEAVQSPPVIERALEAGCHVLSEKPACVRPEDFARLVRKAQEKHRHLMLTLANRTLASVREARRLVREGMLGKVYGAELHLIADQARLTRPEYHKSWFAHRARAGGGSLIWLGIHWIDLSLFITGLKVKQVAGFHGNVGGQPMDVEDTAVLAFRFDSGATGTFTSGYYLDKGYHSHIKIWGEHGWLQLSAVEETPLEWYSTKEKEPKVRQFPVAKGNRGYAPFIHEALRACAGDAAPPITGEEGLHVLRTIFSFYEAGRTGRAQQVPS
jgi:predicted dehydrogenase